ncbi:ribosomal RNA small subunit methyltransferase A, partial [Candidatus Bathyarchaeota archaeon]|nr:ribosomal RNA small subunit methyltransferase A [Candidatus Bathyarchaeota archaeon]
KLLLRKHRIFPKKRLGQHFMVEPSIFQLLINYASLCKNDVVLDIGAGLGFLTRFLAEKCGRVLAVEVDNGLVRILHEQFGALPNVEVIKGDVLRLSLPAFNKVVSIPPYNISSALIQWLFNKKFECAVSVFQKEFANRLVAPVGSEDYGWLTVLTYYHFDVELLDDVPKSFFYPQPEIDSIIVRLKPKLPPPFRLEDEALFMKLVQALFTQRNRKVRNAIQPFIKREHKLSREAVKVAGSLPFHDRRVRELAPEDFGELANALVN